MQNATSQLPTAGLTQQTPMLPKLPPGPSLDQVRGPIEIPLLATWQIVSGIFLITLVLILISWLGFKYLSMRKNRVTSTLASDSAAIAELKRTVELDENDDEQFAVLSSLALRRYFEIGKGVDALGKTTDEFLKCMETHALLNSDARKLLAEFLRHCDQVKFAGKSLSETERRTLFESAVGIIQKCEQKTSETTAINGV